MRQPQKACIIYLHRKITLITEVYDEQMEDSTKESLIKPQEESLLENYLTAFLPESLVVLTA